MSERQLRLFEHAKPLLSRFGAEFFRAVPKGPGVYVMRNEAGRIIYVGQSKNLRMRLYSYKNANPNHLSRKVIRLVHAVHSIAWEECETHTRAKLRENELLRTHQPKYNAVNKYPWAYCFIALEKSDDEVTLRLHRETHCADETYGAFKRNALRGFSALVCLFWAAIHQPRSPTEFPFGMFAVRAPRSWKFPLGTPEIAALCDLLPLLLEGVSDNFVYQIRALLPIGEGTSEFQRLMLEAEMETLGEFYRFGPQRNYRLREKHKLTGKVIPQTFLDDLLVMGANGPAEECGAMGNRLAQEAALE